MFTRIQTAFPHCLSKSCLEIENSELFNIIDDLVSGRSIVYKSTKPIQYPHLTVKNPYKKHISVLAIDNCIYSSGDGKKCDCAVFDESVFHFVEFKTAKTNSSKRSAIKNKAIQQLKETITKFSSILSFNGYQVKALLCVGYFKPHPNLTSSKTAAVADFLLNYNIELMDGNIIEF